MPRDDRDYKVELSSAAGGWPESSSASGGRPFLSVLFNCCATYVRIYRSADGTCYRGRCPKCGKPVHFKVGEGGTDCRTFVVD